MDQEKVGKFISSMRKKQNLTQEQLGAKLGVTNKTVSRWETGKYMPDIDMLQSLASILQVSINELLAGERIEDPSKLIKKADENLVAVLSGDSAFGLQDKITYFKRKWIMDHKGLIVFWSILWIIACVACVVLKNPIFWAILPISGMVFYAHLRNQMMIYVEDRSFDSDNPGKYET